MPVTRIKVRFIAVYVRDDSDFWGAGEWKFTASVDGQALGDSSREFTAREGRWIPLPRSVYTAEVNTSLMGSGSRVEARFRVMEDDVFVDDDLGEVTAVFRHPFRREGTVTLRRPAYLLRVSMEIDEVVATSALSGPSRISVSRQNTGSRTLTTVSGTPVTPRIEVCPITPVPANGLTRLPGRPPMPAGLEPGAARPAANPITLNPVPALNAKANPSVIPILSAGDPNLATKAARLAVTYVEPRNLDLSFLTWHVRGPAAFVRGNRGAEVLVRGTGSGADQLAQFEVRWDGERGPLLASYRAWVGRVGTIPYRINLLDGSTAGSRATTFLNAAQVNGHMQVVNALYWQAGLQFQPDGTATTYEGAAASATPGVYSVNVTHNSHSRNVNVNATSRATRYNFRPGVINIAYVHSTNSGTAVASDIQGVTGNNEDLDGTPSTSWVRPSGVPTDAAAKKVTMRTFKSTNRPKKGKWVDKSFVKARNAADNTFTAASMGQLHAAMVPANWWVPDDPAQSGVNLAHELGHVLGLRHRGSGFSPAAPRGDDRVNSKDLKNKMRGHPWHENVMTYGYGSAADPPLALDIDYIQAAVIRRHPAIRY